MSSTASKRRKKAQRRSGSGPLADQPRSKNKKSHRPASNSKKDCSARNTRCIRWTAGAALVAVAFLWAYWPTVANLVETWNDEPDYSHGFLVLPIALFFLWVRRDRFPGMPHKLAWAGLLLVLISAGIRAVGAKYYISAIDGWSILVWAAGAIWLLGGWKVLKWSLPSVAFLWFMIPLPWRVERWASLPLQRVATHLSCWGLQTLGQPAVAEGNVVYINDYPLYIAEACSGLRIFVGIIALAFAYIVLFRRAWWERALLVLSVVPIALVANATRIVLTGLLYQYVSGEAARKFSHDSAGWMMIVFAAALFGSVLWYLDKLVRYVEIADIGDILRREAV